MRAEIDEQPAAVARTLTALREPVAALAAEVRARAATMVVLVARGTSDHAAIYARYVLEARCGLNASLAAPSLYTTYRAPVDLSRALVVGISQSGMTPEIVEALRYARERGALTAALTNGAGSPLAATADHALVTRAGEERSVAATKTFTTQLAALAALAGALGAERVAGALGALPAAMAATLEAAAPRIEPAAAVLAAADSAACVARGFAYAVALETALKLKESAGIWAEGFSSADLRHGPRAAVTAMPVLVFHAGGPLEGDVAALELELAPAVPVVAIGADAGIPVAAGLPEELAPLVLVLPGQLLAERAARLRGRDPDHPPGLSKVTRT
jgi:glucosamine--fructose-6-phosphate aminotransferase (isomerizing)